MFERIQKPFLTVETGEAYQPVQLTYHVNDKNKLINRLNALKCLKPTPDKTTWHWSWQQECDDLHFESLDSFVKNANDPLRIGTLILHHDNLHLHLSSFKRACLAVPFFDKMLSQDVSIKHADFINKVFGTDEKIHHGFSELFEESELETLIKNRIGDYEAVQKKCEDASSAEEALVYLADYTKSETKKRLPYAERYVFENSQVVQPDILFLTFYIFLRSRELVAIRRWFGNTGYTPADANDEVIEEVFGGIGVDIIE